MSLGPTLRGPGLALLPLSRSSTSICGTSMTPFWLVFLVLTILSKVDTMDFRRWLDVPTQRSGPS